jgi:hypothetical protein
VGAGYGYGSSVTDAPPGTASRRVRAGAAVRAAPGGERWAEVTAETELWTAPDGAGFRLLAVPDLATKGAGRIRIEGVELPELAHAWLDASDVAAE